MTNNLRESIVARALALATNKVTFNAHIATCSECKAKGGKSMDGDIKALRAKYKSAVDYGPFQARIRSGQYDGSVGLNQFRHDVPRYFGQSGDILDDFLNKHERLGERERMEAALRDYRGVQSRKIEEINRREQERINKARKLGMEHGRLGRYDPPHDIAVDSTTKRSYDLGYLSTEEKALPAATKGWGRFTSRNPEKGDEVRIIPFGDNHGRTGKVVGVMAGGYALVNFGTDHEERFHRNDLEVWQ